MEVWVDAVGFEEYFKVSNFGRVFSKRTMSILKQTRHKSGYMQISTKIGGRCGRNHCLRVHRLVAKAFIENPDCKTEVNHINLDKSDNHVSNLEWVTPKENTKHAVDMGVHKTPKIIKLSDSDKQFIRLNYKPRDKIFGCRPLARRFNVSHKAIQKVLAD